jgi:hypothetical protein
MQSCQQIYIIQKDMIDLNFIEFTPNIFIFSNGNSDFGVTKLNSVNLFTKSVALGFLIVLNHEKT